MIRLSYGTLPTRSFLHLHLAGRGYDVPELWRVMQTSLRRNGPTDALKAMLEVLGFTWADADGLPDAKLQEAIDAVRAALAPCARCARLGFTEARPAVCTACRTGSPPEEEASP